LNFKLLRLLKIVLYIKLKCLKINNKWKPSVRFADGFRGCKGTDNNRADQIKFDFFAKQSFA